MNDNMGATLGIKERDKTVGEIYQAMTSNQCGRASVKESIASRLVKAESKACEAKRLRRLGELFDKHPDILEILELVRDLGVI